MSLGREVYSLNIKWVLRHFFHHFSMVVMCFLDLTPAVFAHAIKHSCLFQGICCGTPWCIFRQSWCVFSVQWSCKGKTTSSCPHVSIQKIDFLIGSRLCCPSTEPVNTLGWDTLLKNGALRKQYMKTHFLFPRLPFHRKTHIEDQPLGKSMTMIFCCLLGSEQP